ncbi:hypothetical protein CFIO01_10108 [Colletotrichum fioriniae PJ7]|uniref:Heterokaryon incompatibility domain-containing protein n=1 Tax=Colletotrichum fioriniae PJ7 TaxID=1445577 RepID=A0A010Q9D3_9PEZI|nr:hypothetical protein CFIO01_10108 [Colletotrichum fioriniae PJ7]
MLVIHHLGVGRGLGAFVHQRGLQYAWVSTCCIDKSSSAELSEAINSMFLWYKESAVCFVFLSDLPASERLVEKVETTSVFPYAQKTFAACRWFTRGWTLQELIAPSEVEFFDSQWKQFSRKADCLDKLEEITGIRRSVLESSSYLRQTPTAVKMSWAAARETKRVEDRAYSLLGIFDINMPMIYGEGSKAFRRLQEEISRETNDLSLFAWKGPPQGTVGSQMSRGIFARSPSEFGSCSTMQRSGTRQDSQSEFTLTNKGVRFETKLYKHTQGAYVMYLGVKMHDTPVCIILTRTPEGFVRSEPWSLTYKQSWNLSRVPDIFAIHIQKDVSFQEDAKFWRQRHRSFHINRVLQTFLKLEKLESHPEHQWDEFHSTFISGNPDESYAARLDFLIRDTDRNFNEAFAPTLTMGWASSHQQPFAVLYGSEGSHEETFEKALASICTNPQFQATEVQFVTKKIMILHRGVRKVSAFVTTFSVELETHKDQDGIITYHASLSGKISRVEGRNAMLALKST